MKQWSNKLQIKDFIKKAFQIFPVGFWIPNSFSILNPDCSNLLDLRNLEEQEKLFWPFTVWIDYSTDLKIFAKFSAFSLEFRKFFSLTRTIFSHSRSGQFWKQNTIFLANHIHDWGMCYFKSDFRKLNQIMGT